MRVINNLNVDKRIGVDLHFIALKFIAKFLRKYFNCA